MDTRVDVIELMYQYRAEAEDHAIVDDESMEVIYNWYVEGFPKIEPLKEMFDIEFLYDHEIDFKIFVKDKYISEK